MSQTQAIAASPAVRTAIVRAAQRTGIDFDYLLAQARIESGFDSQARAVTSSAAGLYQFTGGTWLDTLDRHGAQHGLDWAAAAIEGGRVHDPALRSQVMALRFDPDAAAAMAAGLASDNRGALSAALGREPDATELYLAHFLGADGAVRFLSVLKSDPGRSAAALLPAAAAANRGIFLAPDGQPRSVAQVLDLIRARMTGAMAQDGGQGVPEARPIARQFAAVSGEHRSMARVLEETFGPAPGVVGSAYARLQALGL